MLRRIKKLVRPNRKRLLSLVMLPTFFFATLPHTACICADGHREPSCNAAACRGLAQSETAQECCGCKCCLASHDGQARSCCQGKSGRRASEGTSGLAGLSGSKANCCHPIVESPAPATVSKQQKIASGEDFVAAIDWLPVMSPATEVAGSFRRLRGSTPPPRDVVILFAHLTI
jgi:hypothetical protein